MTWLPIQYRDFYDVPRMVVVEREGQLYLLDSAFDPGEDEYSDHFTIYKLPAAAAEVLDRDAWVDLPDRGEALGRVEVVKVEFDQSKRRFVSDEVFTHVRPL